MLPGSAVKVGLILPTDQSPKALYVYGPSAKNAQPHWAKMDTTTVPAAILFGNVSLMNPAGNTITANISQLMIVDGGDGDGDGAANGVIKFTGAADINPPSSGSSSGSISIYWLLLMGLITLLRKQSSNSRIQGGSLHDFS